MKKVLFFGLIALLIWSTVLSAWRVDPEVKTKIHALKQNLELKGYQSHMVIPVHGKRSKFENFFWVKCFGASPKSQHLEGQAIDLLVLDVNGDSKVDEQDLKIVNRILDLVIVNQHGGVGNCLKKKHLFSKQLIHFDTRGYRARWYDQSIASSP